MYILILTNYAKNDNYRPLCKAGMFLINSQQTFSVKGQIINTLDVRNHIVSVTNIQLCCCNVNAPIDST